MVHRDAQTVRISEPGRSTSNYLGIATGDPYSRPLVQTPTTRMPSRDGSAAIQDSSSATATSPSEEVPSTDVDSSTQLNSRLGQRRMVNPYDLSHIFPDIYNEPEPPSFEDMTNQSLDLLEMTVVSPT